jgi:hypothetical protein
MAICQEDKGSLQFDWSRANTSLGTRGQQYKNALQNAYMATFFVGPRVWSVDESLTMLLMETQTFLAKTKKILKLHKFHNLYILIDISLVLSRGFVQVFSTCWL